MENKTIDYEAIRNRILSYSSLKEFRKSPEHFLEYMFGPKKTTAALEFGTLIDRMILTPDEWQGDFVVKPEKPPFLKDLVEAHGKEEGRKRFEDGKLEFDNFLLEHAGKSIVSQEDMDTAILITNKVRKNRAAKDILERITGTQQGFKFEDKKTGLKLRGFKDADGQDFVLDLKTTISADPNEFIRSAIKYDYPLQCGVYLEAEKVLNFRFPDYYFLCVEKTPPYGISVLKASDDFIAFGRHQLRETLDSFKWCLDNLLFNESYEYRSPIGFKEGLSAGWHSLELPAWIKKQLPE